MNKITLKIINAGDGGVGKTTLLYRYVENNFKFDTKMTIGVGFFYKEVKIDDITYGLQLWDLGGEEHFRAFLNKYVDGANGAFLMFDLTRLNTLKRIEEWVNIIRKSNPKCPILFLGTKLDLQDEISVDDKLPLDLKAKFNFIDYLKVSSKTGYNVNHAFELLTEKVAENQKVFFGK